MNEQLRLFTEYKQRLSAIAGAKRGAEIISQALFVVCAGTDDVANTYFTTPFRQDYDIPSYVNLLISSASDFLKARKLPPLTYFFSPQNRGSFSRQI